MSLSAKKAALKKSTAIGSIIVGHLRHDFYNFREEIAS